MSNFEWTNRTSIVHIVKTFVLSIVLVMFYEIILYTPMYVTLFWAIILLFTKRENNLAKYFLGVFMVAAFLVYLSHAVFFHGEKHLYLYFDPIYTFSSLLVYPLYYIYIKLLSIDTLFKKKNYLLLLPAFLLGGITFLLYQLMSNTERSDYIVKYFFNLESNTKATLLQKLQRIIFYLGRITFTIQVFYFLYKDSRLIKMYNKRIANFYSNTADKTINWVELLLWSFVITSIMSIVFNMIGKHYFLNEPVFLIIPSAIFSTLLFFIGFEGFMQNHTISNLISDEQAENKDYTNHPQKNVLKENLLALLKDKKIYRNPDLKITDLSALLNSNRTYISHLINTDFNLSFSDFINNYRIEEAKKLLKSKSTEKYTLEYIAEKVGFGSLHTFIRVFKKMVGKTPGIYKDDKN